MNGNTHKFRLFENLALRGGSYGRIRSGRNGTGMTTQCVWSLDMKKFLSRFVKDESGATAIEYGLIAAGIAVVIVTAVRLAGTNLNTTWNTIATNLL
jgi:pilus assembly protein Flp/PilA